MGDDGAAFGAADGQCVFADADFTEGLGSRRFCVDDGFHTVENDLDGGGVCVFDGKENPAVLGCAESEVLDVAFDRLVEHLGGEVVQPLVGGCVNFGETDDIEGELLLVDLLACAALDNGDLQGAALRVLRQDDFVLIVHQRLADSCRAVGGGEHDVILLDVACEFAEELECHFAVGCIDGMEQGGPGNQGRLDDHASDGRETRVFQGAFADGLQLDCRDVQRACETAGKQRDEVGVVVGGHQGEFPFKVGPVRVGGDGGISSLIGDADVVVPSIVGDADARVRRIKVVGADHGGDLVLFASLQGYAILAGGNLFANSAFGGQAQEALSTRAASGDVGDILCCPLGRPEGGERQLVSFKVGVEN